VCSSDLFIHLGFFLASFLILLPIFIYAWRNLKRIKRNNTACIFFGFGTILSLGLISLVLIGSVINPSQHDSYIWSWSMIFRYFLIPAVLIQLTYYLIAIKAKKGTCRNWVLMVITMSFVYTGVLKGYNYTANYKAFNFSHNTALLKPNNSLLYTYILHQLIPNEDNSRKLILIDEMVANQFIYTDGMLGIKNFVVREFGKDNPIYQQNTSLEQNSFIVTNRTWEDLKIGNTHEKSPFASLENGIKIYSYTWIPD